DAARERAESEEDDPDGEEAAPPEQIGERPADQQERGQCQRVGVDHPLKIGERGIEAALDVGQRDVYDRDVQQEHEDAGADRDQRPPLPLHLRSPPSAVTERTIRYLGLLTEPSLSLFPSRHSLLEDRQIERAEALRVGEEVELDDPPVAYGEC